MKLKVRTLLFDTRYKELQCEADNAVLASGILDADEQRQLALDLLEIVWEFGQTCNGDRAEWLAELIKEAGIELPKETEEENNDR